MTRQEVVHLVSRAIAAIQFVFALVEITYLPERMLAVHHYGPIDPRMGLPFLGLLERVEISSLLLRISVLLTIAWVFWNCGPRVAKLLLPPLPKVEGEDPSQTGHGCLASPE